METLQAIANVGIILTAIIGILTLILQIIKEIHYAMPQPFRP